MSLLISGADLRSVATPAATMLTYASPSTEPPSEVALWRTQLPAGTSGPVHSVDREHVVVVLEGTLQATVGEEELTVVAGDAVRLPADVPRRLAAAPDGPAVTMTAALPGSTARVGDAEPVPVPWAR